MHELSVCQSLIGDVARVAHAHDAKAVETIVIAVGPLSGVEPALLERTFPLASAGSIAAGARLVVEAMPVTVWCESCGYETEVAANALLCGGCGGWQVNLRSGNELILKSVELAAAGARETEGVA